MPIQGVSDRDSADPRFKNIGKLRKGGPKRNGQFGIDLDHFRFTSEQTEVVSAFYEAYGEQPARLEVFLPYDEMERCFSSWRELYGRNGLCKCRCDGSHWVDWIIDDQHHHGYRPCTKEFRDTENRCPGCPLKQVGRLSVILPALWAAGHIGLVTVETHSWNDIAHLSAKLTQWEPLPGKPFTLWREQEKIGAPINGKRAAVEKSLVKIELTDSYLQDLFNSAQQKAIAAVASPESPEPETSEAEQFVEAEFTTPADESPSTPEVDSSSEKEPIFLRDTAMLAILQQKLAKNPGHAARMVNLSHLLNSKSTDAEIISWASVYRAARDEGLDTTDAAKRADVQAALEVAAEGSDG